MNVSLICTPEERSVSSGAAAAESAVGVGVFTLHHTRVLMRNSIIYSANEKSRRLYERKASFLHPGRLTSHWLHIQSVNGRRGWSKMLPNGSKGLTSLHKIPERHKGRTDETQHGADGALADAWRALAAWTAASQELWLL